MIKRTVRPSTRAGRGLVAALALLLLTGCGLFGDSAAEYGTKERTITVEAGEEFTLTVPASPALGQNWYLADPRPACPYARCHSAADAEATAVPVPTATDTSTPGDEPEYYLYEVTIR